MSTPDAKWHTGILKPKDAALAARRAQSRLIAEAPIGDDTVATYLVLGYLEAVPNHGRNLGWWGELEAWPLRRSVFEAMWS